MRMILTGHKPLEDYKLLKVQYCAVCRTDAKMWNEGHRDLVLPRVPGHEIVAIDSSAKRVAVWPGINCGGCGYCLSGRENLCEHMKIIGFHTDGGFADYILAPQRSLIPVPDQIPSLLVCFAEPTGCALNAVDKLKLKPGDRMIIYGGGTLGLIAALVCLTKGAIPLIVEKSAEKIDKAKPFLDECGIQCRQDTGQTEFEAALNACPDHIAFNSSILKLAKGGRFSFFSGLSKNQNIQTDLLNLMHYKEAELYGTYGLTRNNMAEAVVLIEQNVTAYEKLIEDLVPPQQVPSLFADVLSGKSLKYIIDFTEF
ncbi:MAG: alcohol dehydrogenase catalytic domain-containing protein [Desulfobacterales bacterium]